jgi:hypothetical protein
MLAWRLPQVRAAVQPVTEKIMSKTNDPSKLATLEDHNTLADTELNAVTGGMLGLGNVGQYIKSVSEPPTSPKDPSGLKPKCWPC